MRWSRRYVSVNRNSPINWSITPTEAPNTFPFGTPNGWQKLRQAITVKSHNNPDRGLT
jgi:hypothetical protein